MLDTAYRWLDERLRDRVWADERERASMTVEARVDLG